MAGNILKRDESNSIVMVRTKKMEIVRDVETCFGMLLVHGSKVLSARLVLMIFFMQKCGGMYLELAWRDNISQLYVESDSKLLIDMITNN